MEKETIPAVTGEPLKEAPLTCVRILRNVAINIWRRFKAIAVTLVALAVGGYDVISSGGIDLNGVLTPLIGDKVDVGRLLSTTALMILIARFAMQANVFKSSNRNGLDNPDEPEA